MVTKIYQHPFKEGIWGILRHHFSGDLVKRFDLEFEVNIYNPDVAENIWRQRKDDNLILEVRYRDGVDTSEYICDVKSWESRKTTEAKLLRYITDAFKTGKIGKDWIIGGGGMIHVSQDVLSGKYETKQA